MRRPQVRRAGCGCEPGPAAPASRSARPRHLGAAGRGDVGDQRARARRTSAQACRGRTAPLIDRDIYLAVGGVQQALSLHATTIASTVCTNDALDSAMKAMFRALTERRVGESGGQDVRRPQRLKQIAAWTERPWQDFVPIIKAFSADDVHFIRFTTDPATNGLGPDSDLDISHEALIRQWQSLQTWVGEEWRKAAEYRRLRTSLRDARPGELLTGASLGRAIEWRDASASTSLTRPRSSR